MKQTETCSYLCSTFHMCIKPRNQIFTQEHYPSSRGYVKLNKRLLAQVTCTVTCAGDILLSPDVGEAGVLLSVLRFVGFWLWEADLSGFSVNFIMVINKTNSNSKLLCVPDGKI